MLWKRGLGSVRSVRSVGAAQCGHLLELEGLSCDRLRALLQDSVLGWTLGPWSGPTHPSWMGLTRLDR